MDNLFKKQFKKNTIGIIEVLDHYVYTIQRYPDIKCNCLSTASSDAEPKCPKCLGTGRKIKIKKVKAACQESSIPTTVRSATTFLITRNYYIRSTDKLAQDDLIVDNDGIFVVTQEGQYWQFDGEEVYQKCNTVPKKNDVKAFKDNFVKIVGHNCFNVNT